MIFAVLLVAAGCSSVRNTEPSSGALIASAAEADEAQQRLVKKGRSQFLHCNSCHVVDAAAPPPFGDSLGPHLEHIVGRVSASVEGFAYSEELQALDVVWDEETLDRWLQQPEAMVPAMCEPFMGMANPEHRKALIAYLKNPPK
ncbi:MAG: c-type cytochrome [Woeseiaceae bacterium]|nr:c-type cytochrome [Woeseiaceae bacterium]